MAGSWIAKADKSMERRGTKGSCGPATESNISAGLAAGGKRAKKAAFAKAMKSIAKKRKKKGRGKKGRGKGRR
jgi:hypothetical protein